MWEETPMSKFFNCCSANHKNHQPQPNKKTAFKKRGAVVNFNFIFSCICLFLIVFLGATYVYKVTSAATQGFKVSEKERELSVLSLKNEELKQKINHFENMDVVESRAKELGLVEVGKVEHLHILDTNVAMK